MQNEIRLLYYYWELFWRRPFMWLIPGIIVLIAGLFYVLNTPRSYTAEALIVVRSDAISPTLVQSTVANERLKFIEQRVLARDNLLALVKKFDLFPGLRDALTKSDLADIVRAQIRITSEASEPSERFVDRSVFRVSFQGSTPELSAGVTSEIVSMIVNENRRARLSQASDTTKFLEREVDTLTERLNGLDVKWDQFIRDNQNALPSRQSAHLQEISSNQQELVEVEAKSADLASEIRILKAELALAMPLADATVRSQTEQLSALKTQLGVRLSVLSEAHPEIKTLRSRIASLEEEMAQAASQITPEDMTKIEDLGPELGLIAEKIRSAEQQQAALIQRRDQLKASLASVREVVARMPEVEAEMTSLQREKVGTERMLDDMAAKLNTARLGERLEFDQQADQIEVLEQAEIPEYASGPGRKKMMLVVLVLAAGAGLAILFAADIMDKTIRGAFDVTRALEGRQLVVVPLWDSEPSKGARLSIKRVIGGIALLMAGGSWHPLVGLERWHPAPTAGIEQHASIAKTA